MNFVCKKESMKIKNPELSDEETETFTWPLLPKKVTSFLPVFFLALMVCTLSFFSSHGKCLSGQHWFRSDEAQISDACCHNFIDRSLSFQSKIAGKRNTKLILLRRKPQNILVLQ